MARSRHASSAATPSPSPSPGTKQLAGRHLHVHQHEFSSAPTIDGFEALQVEIGRRAIENEQAYAVAIAGSAGRTRRDDQLVGPRRTNHRRLCSAQDKIVPLASRRQADLAGTVCGRPSAQANVHMALPSMISAGTPRAARASQCPRSGPPARTTVSKYGSTTRFRPNSCITIIVASDPPPRPPELS